MVCELNKKIDNGITFSESDIVVGTWIDGKKVYRRVIDVGTVKSATKKEYDCAALNIETVVHVRAICSDGTYQRPIPTTYMDTERASIYFKGSVLTIYVTGADYGNTYVILDYTKI